MAKINGTGGPDALTDTAGNDTITANGGKDFVTVTSGQDVANGGAGEDKLKIDYSDAAKSVIVSTVGTTAAYENTGSNFSDSSRRVNFGDFEHLIIRAGAGHDQLQGTYASWDNIDGGGGVDTWIDSFITLTKGISVRMGALSGSEGQKFRDGSKIRNVEVADLLMSAGDDRFRDKGGFDDVIDGAGGNDDLGTSGGRDEIDGNDGDDVLTILWSNASEDAFVTTVDRTRAYVNTATGWANSSRRVSFEDIEHISAETGSGNDAIEGFANAWDRIDGGKGADTWIDSFTKHAKALTILMEEAAGKDGLMLSDGTEIRNVEAADLVLSPGKDRFRDAGNFDDEVNGFKGNDILGTSGGRDVFDGGRGNDKLQINWGFASRDVVVSTEDATRAYVNNGGGWAGATRRVSFENIEHIIATTGAGNDEIEGFANAWDRIDGGGGKDLWVDSFVNRGKGLRITMEKASTDEGQTLGDGSRIRNIESVDLTLTKGDDVFRDQGKFSDTIRGNAGDDLFVTSGGRDEFLGDVGFDTVEINWTNTKKDSFVYNLDNRSFAYVDNATNFANSTRRIEYDSVEKVVARLGSGDDVADTGHRGDVLSGGGGNDELRGNGGKDVLNGNGGRDALFGGTENDRLNGGTGADTLDGEAGRDRLAGGDGDDTVTGGGGADVFVLRKSDKGTDRITDFTDGSDKIDLDGTVGFGKLRITDDGTDTLIELAGSGRDLAVLEGITADLITAEDFV